MKNLLTEKNDHPLMIGKKIPKMQVYTRFYDKTNDSMIVSFIKSPEKFCEGSNLNTKNPTNKRPTVATANKELRALLKKIFMH